MVERTILAWSCILALVHIFAAAHVKTRQYGAKWNIGARDEALPPPTPLVGRLARAQANFFETYPIAIAAILLVTMSGLTTRWTAVGAIIWLGARILYLTVYALGIAGVRSALFLISVAGIVMLLWPILPGSVSWESALP